MVKLSTTLLVAFGGLASLLTTSAGVATAEPDVAPIINSTCSYSQVTAALDEQRPDLAQQFYVNPVAQGWLRAFIAAPTAQRQEMAQEVQSVLPPEYADPIMLVASTCNNY
jgi:hemophore-related protein